MDSGFIHVVEIGQYFMTKGHWRTVLCEACREYTLPRSDESSQPKGWIQGNTRIGPVLEITTNYLYGKHGIEIRIWSLSKSNSQSWVRISHGSNEFVIDSNYNNTEVPANLPEEQASQPIVKDLAVELWSTIDQTTWENFLQCIARSCPSSWRTSSRRKCAFRKVRRNDSRWIGETCVRKFSKTGSFWKFRHGQWRSRICGQSQKPSAQQTEKNVEHCRIKWKTFNNMGNVHGSYVKCGDIHGKEFLNSSKFRQEFWRSHVETDVRCHNAIGE